MDGYGLTHTPHMWLSINMTLLYENLRLHHHHHHHSHLFLICVSADHITWYGVISHYNIIHLVSSFHSHSFLLSTCRIHTHTHTHTSPSTTPLISAVLAGLNRTPLICSSDWLQWLKDFSHFFSPSNEHPFAHHCAFVHECTRRHTQTIIYCAF